MKDARGAVLGRRRGQTMTETLVMLPFFLVLVFGLLQTCQLGTALVMASYAASKVARNAVRDDLSGNGSVDLKSYDTPDYEALMIAGMKSDKLEGCIQVDGPLRSITVRATAQVNAFPLLGNFLDGAFRGNFDDGDASAACPDMISPKGLGPFNFSNTGGYHFLVRGRTTVRMNLRPT